jgi:hypothetical protein
MAVSDKTATTAPVDNWEKVEIPEAPVRLVWEGPGDTFTGTYQGEEKAGIDPENGRAFSKYIFTDPDGVKVAVDQSSTVREGMTRGNVRIGDEVRLTYVSDTDTGQQSPRRDITVEVKRNTPVRTGAAVTGRYTPKRSA